jgi:hypothetical protein
MNSAASCRRPVRRIAGTFTTQAFVGAGTVAAEKAKGTAALIGWPRRMPRRSESGLSLRDIASW